MLISQLLRANAASLQIFVEALVIVMIESGLLLYACIQLQAKSREKDVVSVLGVKSTVDALNRQLELVNEDLTTSIKSKDEFLLNVSHDLRNPMNILLGNIELAAANLNDKKLGNYLENAKISGELLTFLVNNLIDAGKLQKKQLDMAPVPTNTFTFIERTWATCKMIIQRKNLEGQVFIDKSIPESLLVDSHRLMQILLNLVSNSAKFTSRGGILVIISWVKQTDFNESIMTKTPDELFKQAFNPYDSNDKTESNITPNEKPLTQVSSLSTFDSMDADPVLPTAEEMSSNTSINPDKYANQTTYKTLSYLELMKRYYKLDCNFPRFPDVHHHFNNENMPNPVTYDPRYPPNKNGFLKIEVKDTGCGMKPEDVDKLFKRFSQPGAKPEAEYRQIGTGLGLWLSECLCQAMGGAVRGYSNEGQGSTFVAAIKCQLATITNKEKQGARIQRALVVDDISSNRNLNRYFLESYGVQVTDVAASGLEAFEIYAKKGNRYFDLIFMDVDMPIMNGPAASEKIREHETKFHWKPVIITIITGAMAKEDCTQLMNPRGNIRIDYVFQKPFSLHQCRDLIEQLNSVARTRGLASTTGVDRNSKKCKKGSVLIVDDDQFNTKILLDYLTKRNIPTILASNGKEAVEKFKQFHLDIKLIFMDHQMPIMNGCQATERIRVLIEENLWQNIKIIGLTGNTSEDFKYACKQSGMNAVICKPLAQEQLQKVIDNFYMC
jgi:signal transduction histidine kinase/DNA-binding response OmpR family regulator